VKDEYAPKGRLDPGIWALPDGVARYDFAIKESTTTKLSAEEIHRIGLAQVKEIEGRMLGVAQQLGFKDLKSFNAAITTDPKLHAHSQGSRFWISTGSIRTGCTPSCPEMFWAACPRRKWRSCRLRSSTRRRVDSLQPGGCGWIAARQ